MTIDNWIIYTLISGLSAIGVNFLNRKTLRVVADSTAFAWWFEFFRLIIWAPFFLIVFDPKVFMKNFPLFASIGLIEFFSVYYYMKMHKFAELSLSSIVSQLRIVWVPILAFLVIGENLKIVEYIGIGLVFLGQLLISSKQKNGNFNGVKYSFIWSLFAALSSVFYKLGSRVFAPSYILIAMSIPALVIFPFKMKNGFQRIYYFGINKWKDVLISSILNAITMYFFVLALSTGPVGKISAVFQSILAFQILTGVIFLGENKNITLKILGGLIALGGVLLLV